MKLFVIGLLCWFTLTTPDMARSAEGMYRIVTFQDAVKEALKGDENWKACGDYFASADSTDGKIIYFNFEKRSDGKLSTVFAFSKIDGVIVSIDEKIKTPMVDIIENSRKMMFLISMNFGDYKTGLPCLAKGTSI